MTIPITYIPSSSRPMWFYMYKPRKRISIWGWL